MNYKQVALDKRQTKQWLETRAAVLWSQPAFGDIWYNLMVDKDGAQAFFTNDLPHAAGVDDRFLYIHPEKFFAYSLQERVFITCHEVVHAIGGHCALLNSAARAGEVKYADGATLKFNEKTFQRAMDMVVNDLLVNGGVGQAPADAIHDPNVVTYMDSVLTAYRKIYEDEEGGGGKGGKTPKGGKSPGKGNGPGQPDGAGDQPSPGFDQHLAPGQAEGKSVDEANGERSEAEWQAGVAGALASAKLQGKLPAAIERLLSKVLEPEVDWKDQFRTALTRHLGNSGSTWERLDEQLVVRGIGAPGRASHGAGSIWVAIDTSGSVTQPMMDRFLAEVGGIVDDVNPRRLMLVQCDAKVHECREVYDGLDLRTTKLKGGGGTDFRPVFDKIASDGGECDALLYLTDGYGTFPPAKPGYPVVWGNITKGMKYPFGEVVEVPLKF